jgi:hypothetical protein
MMCLRSPLATLPAPRILRAETAPLLKGQRFADKSQFCIVATHATFGAGQVHAARYLGGWDPARGVRARLHFQIIFSSRRVSCFLGRSLDFMDLLHFLFTLLPLHTHEMSEER